MVNYFTNEFVKQFFVTLKAVTGVSETSSDKVLSALAVPFRRRGSLYTVNLGAITARKVTDHDLSRGEIRLENLGAHLLANVPEVVPALEKLHISDAIMLLLKFNRESGWKPVVNSIGMLGYGQLNPTYLRGNVKLLPISARESALERDSVAFVNSYKDDLQRSDAPLKKYALSLPQAVPLTLLWTENSYRELIAKSGIQRLLREGGVSETDLSTDMRATLGMLAYGRGAHNAMKEIVGTGAPITQGALALMKVLCCGSRHSKGVHPATGVPISAYVNGTTIGSSVALELQRTVPTMIAKLVALDYA